MFVYNFGPDPLLGPACKELLERIELGDLVGYASSHILSDVAHRLMTLEACATFGWPHAGIGQRLRKHSTELQKLHLFRRALDEIAANGVRILPVADQDVLLAGDMSIRHGLLSGDALIVALMQRHGVANLASNDADFDRVSGATRFAPI